MFATLGFLALSMSQPIRLVADQSGDTVRLQLVGESATAVTARYELEATSGTGNRSVQRGTATLRPGERSVLVSVGLGTRGAGWSARLKVSQPEGDYEQSLGQD